MAIPPARNPRFPWSVGPGDVGPLSIGVQASGLIVCATVDEPIALSDEQFGRLVKHVRETGKMVVGRDEILRAVEPDHGDAQ